jgi:hypothetical protein
MFAPVRFDFREMEVVTRSCAVGMDSAVSCEIEVQIYQSISAFVDKDATVFEYKVHSIHSFMHRPKLSPTLNHTSHTCRILIIKISFQTHAPNSLPGNAHFRYKSRHYFMQFSFSNIIIVKSKFRISIT